MVEVQHGCSVQKESVALAQAISNLANKSHVATATHANEVLSPLRYPGGKRRLAPFVAALLRENGYLPDLTVEPFAGGASVSLYLLQQGLTRKVGLADSDPLVASFWKTVFFDSDWLIDQIGSVSLTLAKWQELKDSTPEARRDQALACLYLNRTSFSGIIARQAGPLGGKAQESKYKIGCRFPRATLQSRIRHLGAMADRIEFVEQCDWATTLERTDHYAASLRVFTYLDPPFFCKADKLYRHYFDDADHTCLRDRLRRLSGEWLLSYDSVPSVTELYGNEGRLDLGAVYSASSAGACRKVNEAVVSSLQLPEAEK